MSAANRRANERQTTVNRAVQPCVVKSRLLPAGNCNVTAGRLLSSHGNSSKLVNKYDFLRKYERNSTLHGSLVGRSYTPWRFIS